MPALIATGLPSVVANMTSTVALFPGALTAAYAYRKDLRDFCDVPVKTLFEHLKKNATLDDYLRQFPEVDRQAVCAMLDQVRERFN